MITFGINSSDRDSTADVVGTVLGVSFMARNSSFYDGDYFLAETDCGTIYLQSNLDVDDVCDADWPADKLILVFSGPNDDAWAPFLQRMQWLETPSAVRLR